jgi:hypothetical protein
LPKDGEGDKPNKIWSKPISSYYIRVPRGILHTSCVHLSLFARRSEFGRGTLLADANLILRVQIEKLDGQLWFSNLLCRPHCW